MPRTDATGLVVGSRWMAAIALAAIVAACGGRTAGAIPEEAFPVVANADLAVGSQRLLVGLVNANGDWLPTPDLPVEFDLYAPETLESSFTVEGFFIWTVPEVRGFYRAQVTFDRSGRWQIAAHSPGGPSTTVVPFDVAQEERAPTTGDRAPVVRTPTAGEVVDLSEITTDPEPDPRFYELSLDAALASGQPTVVVFATPGFCESATCGPILDNVKQVAPEFPEVNFVHVEIYENLDATTREELRVVGAVDAWQLPSEPWVFVVDATGTIAARFEGAVDPAELRAALEELS
ncbi:MAG TPA: thioredoxin family protein [Acidimicrobiia bacterium]|nr:thioredoxin family protein [Acidimicrobiia bacterium]